MACIPEVKVKVFADGSAAPTRVVKCALCGEGFASFSEGKPMNNAWTCDACIAMGRPSTADHIAAVCDEVKAMLLAKNKAYGDSAVNPVRVFSEASPREQILVRLDDKLSRLARGSAAGEDVVLDLIGYLVLLRVLDRKEGR